MQKTNNLVTDEINCMTFEEFCDIDGVGHQTADMIIQQRKAWDGFLGAYELKRVPGVGPTTSNRIVSEVVGNLFS